MWGGIKPGQSDASQYGKNKEKSSEMESVCECARLRGRGVGKYDEGKLKVSLALVGQSNQRDFLSARSSQFYIQVSC